MAAAAPHRIPMAVATDRPDDMKVTPRPRRWAPDGGASVEQPHLRGERLGAGARRHLRLRRRVLGAASLRRRGLLQHRLHRRLRDLLAAERRGTSSRASNRCHENPPTAGGRASSCGMNGLATAPAPARTTSGNSCGAAPAAATRCRLARLRRRRRVQGGRQPDALLPVQLRHGQGSCFPPPAPPPRGTSASRSTPCDLTDRELRQGPESAGSARPTATASRTTARTSVCCNIACRAPASPATSPAASGLLAIDTGSPIRAGLQGPGPASCGHDGTCDGVGGCANYATDTQCLASSCTGNRLNTAGTCDGLGTPAPRRPGLPPVPLRRRRLHESARP